MKNSSRSAFEHSSTSRIAHRMFQSRFDAGKTPYHRYERRKVREYLRQGGDPSNDYWAWR